MICKERRQHHGTRHRRDHKRRKDPDITQVKVKVVKRQVKRHQKERHVQPHVKQVAQSVASRPQTEDHLILSEAFFPFVQKQSDQFSDGRGSNHADVHFQ